MRKYIKNFTVHLSETSAYGNAYFLDFHQWAALVKEEFFVKRVPDFSELFYNNGIKLIVIESSLFIKKELLLHEQFSVHMFCSSLKRMKALLGYTFINSNKEIIATAENKIIFIDISNRVIQLPDLVRSALETILS